MSRIIYTIYLKTHNRTGLKYLGYTKQDPYKYQGSGKHWKRHLKKHGVDVSTQILFTTEHKPEIKQVGEYLSEVYDVVNNNWFANLMVERGDGGAQAYETCQRVAEQLRGRPISEAHKAAVSKARKGKKLSKEHIAKLTGGNLSYEHKAKISAKLKGVPKSKEHAAKVGAAQKGRVGSRVGHTNSDTHKKNQSEAIKEWWRLRKENL